jgi:hypothetical protein
MICTRGTEKGGRTEASRERQKVSEGPSTRSSGCEFGMKALSLKKNNAKTLRVLDSLHHVVQDAEGGQHILLEGRIAETLFTVDLFQQPISGLTTGMNLHFTS